MGEQGELILACSRMHDDASLLGLVAVPEVDHEDE
jgi:hypothetical protein